MKGRLNRSFAMHTVEIGEYVYDRSMHIDGKAHIMGNLAETAKHHAATNGVCRGGKGHEIVDTGGNRRLAMRRKCAAGRNRLAT
jgi:hypothetical protein